jgi:hypothetical protein
MLYCRFLKCVLLNFVSNVGQRRAYLNAYVLYTSVVAHFSETPMRLTILLTLIILTSCSNTNDPVNIEERNGIMYEIGTDNLFEGIRNRVF